MKYNLCALATLFSPPVLAHGKRLQSELRLTPSVLSADSDKNCWLATVFGEMNVAVWLQRSACVVLTKLNAVRDIGHRVCCMKSRCFFMKSVKNCNCKIFVCCFIVVVLTEFCIVKEVNKHIPFLKYIWMRDRVHLLK